MTDDSGGVYAPLRSLAPPRAPPAAPKSFEIQLAANVPYLFYVRNMFFFDFGCWPVEIPLGPLSNDGVAQFEIGPPSPTKHPKVSTFEQGAGFAWLYRRYPDHWNLVFNAASKADA